MASRPAKLLRIHLAESDRHEGKPLFEAIVAKCRGMGIAGATVFRGLEGYGETAEMHRARFFTHDQPIVVLIVESAENVQRILAAVDGMTDAALAALIDVVAIDAAIEPHAREA